MRIVVLTYFLLISQIVSAIGVEQSGNEVVHKQYKIHEFVRDGAWTWFNDERVIIDNQVLYIGSIDSQGQSRVSLFSLVNPSGNFPEQEYLLSSWKSKDDHNNPALLKLANGKILTAYAKHHLEPVLYWRIADVENPGNWLTWSSEKEIRVKALATYSNLFQLSEENNRIYNFIRAIGFNPNFLYSDDMADTWQGPFVLIQSGNDRTRPYVKYAGNGNDRIDFLYTDGHPRDIPNNSVYHFYYKDGGFYKSDGTYIKTIEKVKENPLVPSDGTKIYDGASSTGRGWVWDMEYDKNGNLIAAYISSADGARGNDLRYRYARWNPDEKKWIDKQIAFAGTNLYVPENHYAGGIAIDPENTDAVYISTDVIPDTGQKNSTGHYQIFKGTILRDAEEIQWSQLTFDTDIDNIRPVIPRGHGCEICLIWLRGRYKSYTDYKTGIVGIIEE